MNSPNGIEPVRAAPNGKIRTVVVGRTPAERNILQSSLAQIGTLEIVAAADSTARALEILEKHVPELVVVDQRVPVEVVLKILDSKREGPSVVFGSILEGVGLRAYNVEWGNTDQQLVPSNGREVFRKEGSQNQKAPSSSQARQLSADDPIILRLNDKYHVVRVRSILFISSARHYTFVVTQEGFKGIASRSMADWESRLPGNVFVRVHRNTILNLECVERIEPASHSAYSVYLKGIDKPVPLSHRSFSRIKRQFN